MQFSNQPWFAVAAALSWDPGWRANRRHSALDPSRTTLTTANEQPDQKLLGLPPAADGRRNTLDSSELLAAAGAMLHTISQIGRAHGLRVGLVFPLWPAWRLPDRPFNLSRSRRNGA